MKKALSDMTVQKLAPGTYFDTKTPAFGIRVGKNRRTWIAMKGKQRATITLGHYPALSLQDARRKAQILLASPTREISASTYPEALRLYLEQGTWRPGTLRMMKSYLKHFPWKGQLAKITHEDVAQAIAAIERPSAREHGLRIIRAFFNWTIPRYLSSSPAQGIRMQKQPTRERVLTDDELKRVWIAAEQLGQFGVIVRLLCLTGQRRSEIGSLRWEWITPFTPVSGSPAKSTPTPADASSTTSITTGASDLWKITFPASVTKNGREHTVPLGAQCAGLLIQSTPRTTSAIQPFVFPARATSSKSFSAWSKSHAALLKLSGTSGWTLHDIRRSVATNLAALGVRQEVTEKILNHVSGSVSGVAAIYNRHTYFEEMREALQLWENRLLALVA